MSDGKGELSGYYFGLVIEKSTADAPDYEPLFMETAVLVRAASEDQARRKLEDATQTHSYKNGYDETITWSLVEVAHVQRVLWDDLKDISEIGARTFRDYETYSGLISD